MGTVLKFEVMGWGREGVSCERGGDGEKNINAGWGRFLKCGLGMGTNLRTCVIL